MISRVHEMDGSYFENINGVSWEQETRRETARRDFKASFSDAKPPSTGPSQDGTADDFLSTKERDQLYVDMLYTIANAVRDNIYVIITTYPILVANLPPQAGALSSYFQQ